jgi:hypothetical protein
MSVFVFETIHANIEGFFLLLGCVVSLEVGHVDESQAFIPSTERVKE